MSPDEAIATVAACQHGAFTNRQAVSVGFSQAAILNRRTTKRWLDAHRGVYVIAGSPRTEEQRVMAAVLALGPRAVAASLTAAWLHGLVEKCPERCYVAMPPGQHRQVRKGIVLLEASLTQSDVRTVNSIRATGPNRTVVDAAAVMSRSALEAVLDDAVLRGLTTVPLLRRYIKERRLEHRPGMRVLRELLDDRITGVSYKELEKMFLRKLRAALLPEPVRQHPIGRYFVDVAYPDARIAIELDGRAHHFSGKAFREDPRRQNEIVLAGYSLLRFTWEDVHGRWRATEAVLRRAIDSA